MKKSEQSQKKQIYIPSSINFSPFIRQKKEYAFKRTRIESFIHPHEGAIWCLCSSPDGKYTSSAGEDKRIVIYEVSNNEPYIKAIHGYSGHSSDIVHLSWSDDNFLLSASLDSTVKLWHPTENSCLGTFQHDDAVTFVCFKPGDSSVFISCTFGMSAYIWDIKKNSIINTIHFNSPPTAAAFSPNGETVVVGCFNGFCYFYNQADVSYITQFIAGPRHKKMRIGKKITSINFIDDDRLLIASNDSRIRLYSMENFSVICKYLGHYSDEAQLKLSISPDKQYMMATSEKGGAVFIWQIDNEAVMQHKKLFNQSLKDRSTSFEGFQMGKKIDVVAAIFTHLTTATHLHALVSDNKGNIYTILSD
ncbi:WD40 repeat-like protein [Histomonas meleagridis]|uniref:WD40 repeat-like protein n=1 Tax=Histomonas meleagridis TaxID=135588 RepID=UPI00355A1513|nr:WD40 repeat-like protein [Histomonas meleagridis]